MLDRHSQKGGLWCKTLVSRMSHPVVQFGQEPPGHAAATLHTTSDLLVLLAVEGRPFGEVAAAVAARFGAGGESQAWLSKTLVTLLRDGLLFNAVEKLNAAYLLRFAAPGVPGAREALIHLSLPDSGEPPAVRAWAAGLVSAAAAAQAQQHLPGVEQWQNYSPQQVLAGAVAPLGSQPQVHPVHPEQLPWQGATAAGQQPAAASESSLPSSSQAALPAVPPREQQQQPEQQQWQLDQPCQLRSLGTLLRQAAQGPLVPALQLRLTQALASPVAAALTAPLAAAVDGGSRGRSSSGGTEGSLEPRDMRGLVEHNSPVAAEVGWGVGWIYLHPCCVLQLPNPIPASLPMPHPHTPCLCSCWWRWQQSTLKRPRCLRLP